MKKLLGAILIFLPFFLYSKEKQKSYVLRPGLYNSDTIKTINLNSYGVKGDGVTDDTYNLQKAIDAAASIKGNILLPRGHIYLINSIRIRNGLTKFICDGTIKGMGKSSVGIITLDGPFLFHGTPVDGCYIRTNLDMSNGDVFGIHADGCTHCIFEKNYIYGFQNNSVKYGIFLEKNSNYNKIINNKIVGFERPMLSAIDIGLFGASDPYGGFFNDGNLTPPKEPCVGNIIENNTLLFGRYAIDMLACKGSIVTNNYCFKQHHRSIYLANSSNNCIVKYNKCLGYGSSGIVMGYGSNNNTVSNNTFKQIMGYNPPGAEAAINVTSGAYDNKITDNTVETFTNYGIYLAVNVIRNVATNNKISGYYLSGIALENELAKPHPVSAKYSRPNYAPPLIGTKWASKDTEGNIIENNVIGNGYPGRDDATTGIYVSQIGSEYKTRDNIIQNNIINRTNDNNNSAVYLYQDKEGYLDQSKVINNKNKIGDKLKVTVSKGAQ